MGGGLMADLAKYEELDDAQEQIEQLQVELRRFKTCLLYTSSTAMKGLVNAAKGNAHVLVIVGVFLLLILMVMSGFSSCRCV